MLLLHGMEGYAYSFLLEDCSLGMAFLVDLSGLKKDRGSLIRQSWLSAEADIPSAGLLISVDGCWDEKDEKRLGRGE